MKIINSHKLIVSLHHRKFTSSLVTFDRFASSVSLDYDVLSQSFNLEFCCYLHRASHLLVLYMHIYIIQIGV